VKRGYLSQYFEGVAVKRLSSVEVDGLASHQHEFNGIKELKTILGKPEGKRKYAANFIYLSDALRVKLTGESMRKRTSTAPNHPGQHVVSLRVSTEDVKKKRLFWV